MPMPNTVADFWRLLYDYHSDTVVMLNEFDRNDKVSDFGCTALYAFVQMTPPCLLLLPTTKLAMPDVCGLHCLEINSVFNSYRVATDSGKQGK